MEKLKVKTPFGTLVAEPASDPNHRSAYWFDKLYYDIRYATLCRQQNIYLKKTGGVLEPREADDTYNDFNRRIIEAFREKHGRAYLGNVNFYDEDRRKIVAYEKSPFTEYKGEKVFNFGAAFIIPKADETLEEMIRRWNTPDENTAANLDAIMNRIEWLGGKNLIWY